ncbi:hypothetical protein FB567DRAFT_634306 [Paraphoma chrysanthemicola]|uniref:RHS repeat-associated core domain-containing protein n=1 Tax=Paraphoma chrysanthemicola TaxID=798071 RepID=A0A8K0QRT0_9PLEO|nr:hypothetical protein FB567DRAFT_634306 [Paraphoma chrysanthemicola]
MRPALVVILPERFCGLPLPSVVCTIERVAQPEETGEGEDTVGEPVVGLIYSDGFQRVVQSKTRVKDGPLPRRDETGRMIIVDGVPQMIERDAGPRWVTEGWTIRNNKGKAIRQYEPFFTDLPGFEFDVRVGVSPISFFDYAERAVAVLTTEDSYLKTRYGPWKEITFDASDTVTSDPRTDSDVAPYATAYFAAHPDFQTWYQKRMAKPPNDFDRKSAEKTAVAHDDTPSTQFFDNLGRVFLIVAQNKVVCAGHDQNGLERRLSSRVELDIEGNPLVMRDADTQGADPRGRIVAETWYTMLGTAVHSRSMEKGDRWILSNAVGMPIRSWDSRGHMLRSEYDAVGRAVGTFLSTSDEQDGSEKLVRRVVHGDYHPDAAKLNFRGAVYLTLEQAGAAYIERVDWQGNTRETKQRIAKEYRDIVDWKLMESVLPSKITDVLNTDAVEQALTAVVETEIYRANATFDSLGRQVIATSAHTNDSKPSRTRFTYTHSQLETISCNIRDERGDDGSLLWTPFITKFDHVAKGQRKQMDYGNKVSTTYTYDAFFHLTNMLTQRRGGSASSDALQDISYTYDCTGDITAVQDAAKQTQFFRNQIIRPVNEYVYSALHELVRASGREHLGQNNGAPNPYKDNDTSRFDKALPNSEVAMSGYTEFYSYDDARNMSRMRHKSDDNQSRDWTREFEYQVSSRIEPGKKSNCLSASSVSGAREEFMTDEHGNTTRMPHLGLSPGQENMAWDYEDRLKRLDLGGGGIAYCCYGDSGSRTRKVVERAENLIEERIYFGEIEIYRKRNRSGVLIERETLHVHDDQRRVAIVESRSGGSAQDRAPPRLIRYQLSDHPGSSSLELDGDAQLLTLEEYAPYGSTTYQASTADLETPKRYRFTGKERDEESGLSYHGVRYLAPWLGRWTAGDPGGTRDGTNMYRYVRGNPIRLTDPSGLESGVWEPLTFDEIRAPKGDGAKAAEQMWRASAAGNRQLLVRSENKPKGQKTHPGMVEEPTPTEDQLIKLDERPEALVEENFGKITETKELMEKWVAENPPKPGEDANAYRDSLNKFLKATFKRLLLANADPIGRALNKLGVRINKEGGYLEWNGKTPHSNPLETPEHVRNPPKKVRVKGGGGGGGSGNGPADPAPASPPPPTPEAVPAPAPQPAVEPHVEVQPPKEVVDAILKPTEATPGAVQARSVPVVKMANTVMGGLMYGGMAGAALRDIDEGHAGHAAVMAGVGGVLIFAAKRNPWVGVGMVAYGTVKELGF